MSLKCCASFSKSMWCISNTSIQSQRMDCFDRKCIQCCNFNTGLQHIGYISPMGFSRPHKPNSVCTICRSKVDTKDQIEGGCWLRQYKGGTKDRGPWPVIWSPPPSLHSNKRGRKHTQRRQYYTLLTLTHLLIESVAFILCRQQCQ